MGDTWTFHSAGSLIFGRNAVARLGEVAQRLGARRVLVVTDRHLEAAGLLERVVKPLQAAQATVEVYNGGVPEPPFSVALDCTEVARAFRPEVIVGLGGGSNMDIAKLTATLLAHGGTPADYVGDDRIPGPVHPLICIPTTSGTGSEVSAAGTYTDTANHVKVGMLSNFLRPKVAVVDPLLTVSCPRKVTADTGIDALTHAIEAHTAVDNEAFPPGERTVYQGRHPLADLFAEKAIRLIGQYLVRAVRDGSDLEAREGMALAATLAGLAFSNAGVALVHAMEYPVGGATHCSHGEGNGLLLPFVMRFNLPTRPRQFANVAAWLGEDVAGLSAEQAGERAIAAVERLKAQIGIPGRLRELGVREEQLRGFAEKAHSLKRLLRVNPRACTVEDVEAIYRAAY
jgi:alcohol dehydrogenase class IV